MIRKMMLLGTLLLTATLSYCCDVCGASVHSYTTASLPQFKKNYISVSYAGRHYMFVSNGMKTDQFYHSVTLGGQLHLTKKIILSASVPFQAINTTTPGMASINGTGDASFTASLQILSKQNTNSSHTLVLGAGAKLPTGKYSVARGSELADLNFQVGSGSTDYLLQAVYVYSRKNLSFGCMSSYKYNTANNAGFRFGDIISTVITAAYTAQLKQMVCLPYLQIKNEVQLINSNKGKLQPHSGGNAWYAITGLDTRFNQLELGINGQFAAAQNLAAGAIRIKPAFSAHIAYFLN